LKKKGLCPLTIRVRPLTRWWQTTETCWVLLLKQQQQLMP
jgi:hypothetical protein